MFDDNLTWLEDKKGVGSGAVAEIYDFLRFNKAEIDAYRDVLDDIAKELGGRVVKSELSWQDGKPLVIEFVNDWREIVKD